LHDSIEKSINHQKVLKLKEEAAVLMKEKKIKEALEIYNDCLKKVD
jgi:hypothetical protein